MSGARFAVGAGGALTVIVNGASEAVWRPSLTEIVTSKEVAQDEAFADTEFADGTSANLHVPHARGTLVRPLTDQDLREKFDAALALGGIRDGSALAKLIMGGDGPVGKLIDGLNGKGG